MATELERLRHEVHCASSSAELKAIFDALQARETPAEASRLWWAVFAARDASET